MSPLARALFLEPILPSVPVSNPQLIYSKNMRVLFDSYPMHTLVYSAQEGWREDREDVVDSSTEIHLQ